MILFTNQQIRGFGAGNFASNPRTRKLQMFRLKHLISDARKKRRDKLREEKLFERDGLILPKLARDAAQRELSDHLDDFLGDMRRRGKSEKYLANLEFRAGKLIKDCQWNTIKEITADSFQTWRRKNQELATKTVNDYLETMRCFLGWLIKNGRIQFDPLQTIEKVKVVEDKKRQRRALTNDEFCRLLAISSKERQADG